MTEHHSKILTVCSNGNENAKSFLIAIYNFLHLIDDIVDEDVTKPTDEAIAEACVQIIINLGSNPFYQSNKNALQSLIVQGFSAWLDANELERRKKIEGKVLKSWYHEIFWHTAALTGGWPHMRNVCRTFREFDLSEEEIPHGLLRESTKAT